MALPSEDIIAQLPLLSALGRIWPIILLSIYADRNDVLWVTRPGQGLKLPIPTDLLSNSLPPSSGPYETVLNGTVEWESLVRPLSCCPIGQFPATFWAIREPERKFEREV